MLRAVTFDFWGTLVSWHHDLGAQRVAYLARHLRGGISEERVAAAYAQSWQQFEHGISLGYGLPPQTVLSVALDLLGAGLAPADYAEVMRYWSEVMLLQPPPLLSGVPDVLRTLRQRGLLIGLISDTGNSPGIVLRKVLQHYGLRHMFDWLTFSDETGVTKTSQTAFRLTLSALGVKPDEALHVGDRLATDIRGAKSAGLYAALLLESSGQREAIPLADIVLERMAELPEKLAEWQATLC
jgi:putative hydrolase of the HAD superfamily